MARENAPSVSMTPVIGLIVAIAVLYFARELLIPLAFALLLAFLLTPIVKRLESWKIPRAPAAVLVLSATCAIVVTLGYEVTTQLISIAERMPQYSDKLRAKIGAIQGKSSGLSDVISEIEDMERQATEKAPEPPLPNKTGTVEPNAPMRVEVVERHSLIQAIRDYSGALLRPLGSAGLILVFTIFMLIDRENLRNRLLRIMGQQKLQATTKAMDDAGQRVSRYVLMQFLVNLAFGSVISLGLYVIGVPSPLLWGVLGMFLRFLPYIGPVIAGALPFALTLVVTDGWRTPLMVVGLFSVTELIVANFVEPLLYGVHTGLSAVAILVSAVFWTVVWGPIGLVLATPLTVCLTVLGRYTPQLEFLNVLLGDEPALSPGTVFYQRLLALDQQDALNILETLGKGKPLIRVFDEIVIPALAMAERDRHTGQLDARREDFVVASINEFVTELAEAEAIPISGRELRATRVFCIPAHDTADEIAAAMCAHFLTQEGFPAITLPVSDSPGELIRNLGGGALDVVCISAVPPFSAGNARKVAKGMDEGPEAPRIVAGLWTYSATSPARMERLRKSLNASVATTLAEAIAQVHAIERVAVQSGSSPG
ncbi:MAG: AI-2E family transporter [Acidobacteriota bacterium]|nr:AI-2E family transporter [Acidobacteriota bacterium]